MKLTEEVGCIDNISGAGLNGELEPYAEFVERSFGNNSVQLRRSPSWYEIFEAHLFPRFVQKFQTMYKHGQTFHLLSEPLFSFRLIAAIRRAGRCRDDL